MLNNDIADDVTIKEDIQTEGNEVKEQQQEETEIHIQHLEVTHSFEEDENDSNLYHASYNSLNKVGSKCKKSEVDIKVLPETNMIQIIPKKPTEIVQVNVFHIGKRGRYKNFNKYYWLDRKLKNYEDKLQVEIVREMKEMENRRCPTITDKDRENMGDWKEWVEKGPVYQGKKIGNRFYGHRDKLFSLYRTRLDCSKAKTHTPVQQGISGNFTTPCDSIVAMAMGGYYDEDYGDIFIYTGQGGTDTSDQILNIYNTSLTLSVERKIPIRLVRGHHLDSEYAPKEGYRYDGLYWVTDYWKEPQKLKSGGFGANVYRYRLVRLEGQDPIKKRKNFKPKHPKRPSRNEYLIAQIQAKSYRRTKASSNYLENKMRRAGFVGDDYMNSLTINSYEAFSNVNCSSTLDKKNLYIYPPIKNNKNLNEYKENCLWDCQSEFLEMPLLTRHIENMDCQETLQEELEHVYKVGRAIYPTEYQTQSNSNVFSGVDWSTRGASDEELLEHLRGGKKEEKDESQLTLTQMLNKSKKKKTLIEDQNPYKINGNGLIETRPMYYDVNHDNFTELMGLVKHSYRIDDFEQALIDDAVLLREELGSEALNELNNRKVSNAERIRNIIKNI